MPGPLLPRSSPVLAEVLQRLGISLPGPSKGLPPLPDTVGPGTPGYDPTTLANRIKNPSVMEPWWMKGLRTGVDVADRAIETGKGMLLGPDASGTSNRNMGALLAAALPVLGKIVYHGSPYRFSAQPGAPYGKFDAARVGTGEGAAAYGAGMPYLADAPEVAASYTKNATGPFYHGTKMLDPGTPAADAAELLWGQQGNKAAVIDDLRAEQWPGARAIEQALRDLDPAQIQFGGPVYRVDLPDEQIALMLDWDARLKDQPLNVQRIANEYFGPDLRTRPIGRNPNLDANLVDVMWRGGSIGAFPEAQVPDILSNIAPHVPLTGQGFYESVGSQMLRTGTREDMRTAMQQASDWLRARGVPGLKYWDQASRAGQQGTRNYVMFDPNIPKIVGIEQ